MRTCKRLGIITRRYKRWNLRNLQRIKDVGVGRWLKEQAKKVKEGFVAGEVIASIKPKRRKSRRKKLRK